ncbi:hypothetical protein E3P81_04021 [Wallemia ichthyophaga]|nr:hypothetical protein E3P97_04030 [Wallemia ichthyophaga]TIB27871.1 hypothetical protein E3P85_04014 [Wallemia ichthyophaga]TIB43418.1 hypothetical protein E3P82_04018 [Wallemia ichthyophaga]TIB45512.1 hypothetical protein E3P81_04021 [Wallemia ichthyophaga]TIB47408.1 hypothetical protein E3P80_04033 [Wallemia ichthyophaga]
MPAATAAKIPIPIFSSSIQGFDPCTAWCPTLHLTTHSSITSSGELLVDVLQFNETIATMSLKPNGRGGLGRFGYLEMQFDKEIHMMPDTGYSALSASPPRISTPYLSTAKCVGNVIRTQKEVLADFVENKEKTHPLFRSMRSKAHQNRSFINIYKDEAVNGVECFILIVCRKLFAGIGLNEKAHPPHKTSHHKSVKV